MTRMAEPGRPQDDLEDDEQRFEDEGRRSIFSALWFRAILVVVVLGVVAAVAVPYVLELANQPPAKPTIAARPENPPPAPMVPQSPPAEAPSPQAPPASPAPTMEKPAAAEKPLAPEKPPVAEKAPTPGPERAAPAPSRKADTRSAAVANESTTPHPKATSPAPSMQGQGAYFVQVGAFKSQETAKRLATRLRELKYNVEETAASGGTKTSAKTAASAPAPSGSSAGDKYDVYVMGGTAGDINAKLGPKGLTSEPSAGGVIVKPSLPLRDAVALSKDLAVDGLKVQVRRSNAGAASAPAAAAASVAAGADGHYRVRVGPFDDRATATSTMRELQQRGYTPFIARAGQ
jgi:cell division septation protein DedD